MISSFLSQQIKPPNELVEIPLLTNKKVELWIKREDQIHKHVSGNKFRKLKYNLSEAKDKGHKKLLTFGGAFSNHILATAVAGNLSDFETIGVIRGDELGEDIDKTLNQNATLKKASNHGMKFVFVSREQYRDKMNPQFMNSLKDQFGNFYAIPEGGTNSLAVKGCEEILTDEDTQFDYICCCVGTGGTISGLIKSSESHQEVLGFPALKGDFLKDEILKFTGGKNRLKLITDYHFGGYGRYSEDLIDFINKFRQRTSIPLDPIYTGKMMYGILDMVKKNLFPEKSKILAVHTGGLQGIAGFNQRLHNKGSNLKIEI